MKEEEEGEEKEEEGDEGGEGGCKDKVLRAQIVPLLWLLLQDSGRKIATCKYYGNTQQRKPMNAIGLSTHLCKRFEYASPLLARDLRRHLSMQEI